HLPKLRLKFGSIRGALHFKSLCNKAHRSYHTSSLVLPNSVFVLLIRDAENVPVFKRGFDGLGRNL
ncbi:hypothetical protein, partial [Acinetobacter baumannii]|uniref:hypothetical protein n=1 Tax=Acinetobacter baumannii TaxID=470 RepID=UPI001BB46BE5